MIESRSMRYLVFISFILISLSPPLHAADDSPLEDVAEQLLLQGWNAAKQEQWQEATEITEQLSKLFPNWRAGQLALQTIQNQTLPQLSSPKIITPATDENIESNLYAEIFQRFQFQSIDQDIALIPASIARLHQDVNFAIVVDLSLSRLFVLKNTGEQLKVITNYYAGIGKQGAGKQKRGDHKTPIGVYQVVSKIPDKKLDELYGIGAMPLDYPNTWDKRLKRTGSGIWLHGVPRDTYSRAPYSSRGCVTVSNELFTAISTFVTNRQTPVILEERVDWVTSEAWQQQQETLSAAIEKWRSDWSSLDFNRYISNYSKHFISKKENYTAWKNRKSNTNSRKTSIDVKLTRLNIFRYPGEENLIQVDYRQQYKSNNFNASANKRQYWQQENGQWKIVYEGTH